MSSISARRIMRAAPAVVGREALSGAVVAVVCIAYNLSFAALLFSGPLAAGLERGLAATLVSTGLCAIAVASMSGFRFAVAAPDTPAVAVMGAMAPALAASVTAAGRPDLAVPTVLATLSLSAVLAGIVLWTIGILRLGVWMRFIPYPVVGGFLAASGMLLCLGAVRLLTGIAPSLETLPRLAEPARLYQLVAGAGFAVLLLGVQHRLRYFATVPVALLGGAIVAHGGLWLAGLSPEAARTTGWLLAPGMEAGLWPLSERYLPGAVDWRAVVARAPEIAAIVGVTAITILLNATGLEVQRRTHADIDLEFRAGGLANLLSGAAGGIPGNLSLNRTLLNARAGGRGRASGIAAGVISLLLPVVGTGFIGLIPTPILGGLLLCLGLTMLDTWLLKSRRRLSWAEYLLVLTILYLIVDRGYLEGAVMGLVASCLFFAITYSRIRVVKQAMTRAEYGSYVERSAEENRALRRHGDLIQILWLQGYLFFGTANGLYEDVRARFRHLPRAGHRWLVLDFRAVTGIDSSAVFSFVKLRQFAEKEGLTLVLCAMPPSVLHALSAQGIFADDGPRTLHFGNLDQALEWCEEQLLAEHPEARPDAHDIESWLSREMGSAEVARRFIGYLAGERAKPGDVLFHQGEAADCVLFVLDGRVSVVLEQKGGRTLRLRTMLGQTVIGEMGMYRDMARAASVVVEQPSEVYRLDRRTMARMQDDAPQVAAAFHAMIVRTLADRLGFANNEIAALQR